MTEYPHNLFKIETGWKCLTCGKTWQRKPSSACALLQQGEHLVMAVGQGYVRCMKCERLYNYKAWGACAGVKQYNWEPWPDGLFTERQLRDMKSERETGWCSERRQAA